MIFISLNNSLLNNSFCMLNNSFSKEFAIIINKSNSSVKLCFNYNLLSEEK